MVLSSHSPHRTLRGRHLRDSARGWNYTFADRAASGMVAPTSSGVVRGPLGVGRRRDFPLSPYCCHHCTSGRCSPSLLARWFVLPTMQHSLLCLSLALLHLSATARANGVGRQGKYQDQLQERELGGPLWTSPIVVLGDYGVGKNVQQGGHGYQTSSATANINGNGNTVTQDKSQQQVSGYNTSQVQDSQETPPAAAEGGPQGNTGTSGGTVSGNAAPPTLVQSYNQAGDAGNMAESAGQPTNTSMGGTAAQALSPVGSSGTPGTNAGTQTSQVQTGQRTGYPSESPIRGQALGQESFGTKPSTATAVLAPLTKANGHGKHRHIRIHTAHKSHTPIRPAAPALTLPQQTVEQQRQGLSPQQQQQPQPPAQQQPLSPPQHPAQQRPQALPYPQQPSYSRPPPQWATENEPPWATEQRAKAEAKAAAYRQATYGRSMVQRRSRTQQH